MFCVTINITVDAFLIGLEFGMKKNVGSPLYLNYVGFQCLEQIENESIDMYLSTCGMQNCFPDHSFGPGKRDEFILHFICEGKGVYESNGKKYELEKGDMFLIWPEEEVSYKADSKNPWSYIWIGFQGVKATSYLKAAGFDKETLVNELNDTSIIYTYVQQMFLYRQLTISNELKRDAALLQIFAFLIDYKHKSSENEENYDYPYSIYVKQAKDFIKTNFNDNIRINDIANYIGIDRTYLSQIFKKTLNLSPQEYLLKYRIDQAKNLLVNSDEKVSSIAREVGYSDSLAFSKIFKKESGLTPVEYRKSKRSNKII